MEGVNIDYHGPKTRQFNHIQFLNDIEPHKSISQSEVLHIILKRKNNKKIWGPMPTRGLGRTAPRPRRYATDFRET